MATSASLVVQADQPGVSISSNLFGIFFEEINHAGDGGLYAELVRNRSFEESGSSPSNWTLVTSGSAAGQIGLDTSLPLNAASPRSLKLTLSSGAGTVGAANNGYWGIALTAGADYYLNFYARGAAGFVGPLTVSLESTNGVMVYAQATASGLTTNWQHFALTLTPNANASSARLALRISILGTVWLDSVSLFPAQTFDNRANGLRLDLANMLAALQPSFLRFPGGNFIEGYNLTNAVRWKTTIGDIAARPGHQNDAWGYFSTDGLGLHEYLQLCEDLGMEPLYGINCGLALNYNGNTNNTVPLNQMGPWVQDALDLIQYANGDTNTTWGAQRAANGHPAPFNLKYIEIGNENGGSYYNDRYALFYDAIKSNYPAMHIVANVWGGIPSSRPVEIMDEHYYSDPNFFIGNATRYDTYSRSGPKVYVGEYAVTTGAGNGNLAAALGEAAFLTGVERNSDIVIMASYAPLLANLNNKAWNPDLIYYNSTQAYGTPSYYAQQMFSRNRGDVVLPLTLTWTSTSGTNQPPHGAVGLGSWNTSVQYTNIVVTSNGVTLYQSDFAGSGTNGWSVYNGSWSVNNGVYQQTAIITDCRSTTGNTNWASYTLTLRARKVSGNEGFLILFNWLDDNNWTWWNIGGWNNTQHALEQSVNGTKSIIGQAVSGSITTGTWYDIRLVINGARVQCYLNNQLINDAIYPIVQPLVASASYSARSGQIIVKAVNDSGSAITNTFYLNGVASIAPQASLVQLTSGSALNENSPAAPTNVFPATTAVTNAATNFVYTFPANSLSVLRLQTPPALPIRVQLNAQTNLNYLASASSGIPVALSSFITNTVSVDFTVEAADGTVVTNGTLQFVPGDLALNLLFPAGIVQPGAFFRVTLSNPVNCQLTGPARSYFALASASGDPLQIGLAGYPDERLVYWTDPAATLQVSTNVSGGWATISNAVCPIRIPEPPAAEFFRLSR
jgi:alpha-L-arabinofuranosidase